MTRRYGGPPTWLFMALGRAWADDRGVTADKHRVAHSIAASLVMYAATVALAPECTLRVFTSQMKRQGERLRTRLSSDGRT